MIYRSVNKEVDFFVEKGGSLALGIILILPEGEEVHFMCSPFLVFVSFFFFLTLIHIVCVAFLFLGIQ